MEVMIGIDPHRGSHTAVAIDAEEVIIDKLQVRASATQTVELLGWADRFGLWPVRADDHAPRVAVVGQAAS